VSAGAGLALTDDPAKFSNGQLDARQNRDDPQPARFANCLQGINKGFRMFIRIC